MIGRFLSSLSLIGLGLGLLFFAASLTPSLLPRPFYVQGALSGLVFMVGYGLGWVLNWLWSYLGLPRSQHRLFTWAAWLLVVSGLAFAGYTLGHVADWQNTLRALMSMEPLTTAHPFRVSGVAGATALFILALVRLLIHMGRIVTDGAVRVMPPRVAGLLAILVVMIASMVLFNNFILSRVLQSMDEAFAELNSLMEPDVSQPTNPDMAGSAASLLDWNEMGRRGREFVVTGPTKEEIATLTGDETKQPLRVYAGYVGQDGLEDQAQLALQELIRIKAFERSVLIVATPTGTGWMDPSGVDPVEYLHRGDTAIVALQYSYLPSWTTLMIDPDRSREAARILFEPIYKHWSRLPVDKRPELYLFGLSLGALGSEASTNFIELMNAPINGALWSGPPFLSRIWRQLMVSKRLKGPAWLPTLPDDRLIRFAGPEGVGTPSRDGWGNMRVLYIQHASDPMVFFSPDLLFKRPRWLDDRGPDVSPEMRWRPLVMFLQVGFDIFLATSVPLGYGHNYEPGAYTDGWLAVTDPEGWPNEKVSKLKSALQRN